MTTTTHTFVVEDIGTVEVTVTERGQGRPFLLLHGGAGPQSVTGFADLLGQTRDARVITPTHPGFGATPRPEALASIPGLAALYVALLDGLDLADVTVIGNSIGGWIAAEMALRDSARIGSVVLVDAVGIEEAEHPVVDFFSLTMDQVAQLSYHDPASFRIDPAALPAEQQAILAGNRAALAVYGGTPSMVDPDRIVDPDYGRAYAAAIPAARFHLLTDTGHVPQIETPQQLLSAIQEFADALGDNQIEQPL